jgi:hypothetical protein
MNIFAALSPQKGKNAKVALLLIVLNVLTQISLIKSGFNHPFVK